MHGGIIRVVSLLLLAVGCAHAPTERPSGAGNAPFVWLMGCWESEDGASREVWTRGADGLMFGFNVVHRKGEVAFFEQLRLERRDAGWVYVAAPRGGEATEFVLQAGATSLGRSESEAHAAFVNPEHDYPQRIDYRVDGDRLRAEISDLHQSEVRSWAYRRCQSRAG